MFYSVRSERLLCEQLNYNLLFRWFVGLSIDDPVFDHSTYTKNRDRLLSGNVARQLFSKVVEQANKNKLISSEHFSVDGTLVKAWASQKSFVRKGPSEGPPAPPGQCGGGDFRGETRSNETHASLSDGEARLYRKGQHHPAVLSFLGHVLMENRNGLIVDATLTQATGRAEREAALEMAGQIRGVGRISVGADKGYDARDFVAGLRQMNAVPHVAQNTARKGGSAIGKRTTRHLSYAQSQRARKGIEKIFGWAKTIAGFTQTKVHGVARIGFNWLLALTGYNLIRMRNLLAQGTS
jgi:IS5 family transposase